MFPAFLPLLLQWLPLYGGSPQFKGSLGAIVLKKDMTTNKFRPRNKAWHWSDKHGVWYSSKQEMVNAEKGKKAKTADKSGTCGKCGRHYADLLKHKKQVHTPPSQCAVCGVSVVGLSQHMMDMHPKELAAQHTDTAAENQLRAQIGKRSLGAAANATAAARPGAKKRRMG